MSSLYNEDCFGLDYSYIFDISNRKNVCMEVVYPETRNIYDCYAPYTDVINEGIHSALFDNFVALTMCDDVFREGSADLANYDLYSEKLTSKDNQIGCVRVAQLCFEKSHDFHFCEIGEQPIILDDFRMINHLVFNFEKQKLNVHEQTDDFECSCIWYEEMMQGCMTEDGNGSIHDSAKKIVVDISSILDPDTAFNHASCQCYVPKLPLTSFQVVDYPILNHIHLQVVPTSRDTMLVYTAFGGIVAL